MLSLYGPILAQCEPYLIANPWIVPDLNLQPLGLAIPPHNVLHPQERRHAAFLQMLQLVDKLTFGPFGMEMPSWVFYDCAVMPGAVFGLAIRAEKLEDWAREAMQVPPGYTGLVPVSLFIAIPMLAGFAENVEVPHTWLLYTLESLNQVSPGIAPAGILKLTLALGLRVFPIQTLYGTTQWRSPKLKVYADLGPLALVTAYTPAHSLPRTLSFRLQLRDVHHNTLLASPRVHPAAPPPNTLLDVDDVAALRQLQRDIEAGWRVYVVGHTIEHGAHVRVPLHRAEPPRSDPANAAPIGEA